MSNESANWHNQGDLDKIRTLRAKNKRLRRLLKEIKKEPLAAMKIKHSLKGD